MFAAACATAKEFTRQVTISSRRHDGTCKASIGSFVVINDEGWVITAFHIICKIRNLEIERNAYLANEARRQLIRDNPDLEDAERERQLEYTVSAPNAVTNFSVDWGGVGIELGSFKALPEADLAVGRLTEFDAKSVSDYPKFKDPDMPMNQGTSLCKMGFPFHNVLPVFDAATKTFSIDAPSVPFFPIEGIMTRTVEVKLPTPRPYLIAYLETSSPGLRGQSGGPTLDVHGAIWAIQSQTQHLSLGFGNDKHDDSKATEHLQHQYLHLGWGTHAATIVGFLRERGVPFHLSPL